MKYIIELEDEPYMREDGVNYYTCKSARWYKLGETIINRLTPYTEPDREAIEDEVWGLVGVIANMDNNDFGRVFGCIGRWTLLSKKTYQEVKARYDSWKKQKDEIHVGDEIVLYENVKMVVTQVDHGTSIQGVDENGECYECVECNAVKKTGRHFTEIEELLKKLGGE